MRRTTAVVAVLAAAAAACGGADPGGAGAGGALGATGGALTSGPTIYADALAAGWSDWSWATRNLANAAPVYAGTRSIAVTYGPWTGLYFHSTGTATAGYATLDFAVNGGATSHPALTANVTLSGQGGPHVAVAPYCTGGAIPANAWTRCRVPLSALGAANVTIDGVILQEGAGRTLPVLYVDAVQLGTSSTAVPPAPSGLAAAPGASSIALSWSAVAGATGYQVYRATAQAGPYTRLNGAPLTTTAYTDAAVTAGTTYWYEVSAVNAAGEGARSAPVSAAIASSAPPPTTACLGSALLSALGKSRVMVGFSGADAVASQAPYDLRYTYLTGPIRDPTQKCVDYSWWGCWQDLSQPPGQFVTGFVGTTAGAHEVPMFTYYTLLQSSGVAEGSAEVTAANDAAFMTRYLTDFRFLAQRIGAAQALVQIEPDFWGYAEQVNADPHAIPAAVASADATDCAGYENSIAGLGRCMVHIVRTYAPNAKVGLHASGWGTRIDALFNASPSLDETANGTQVGSFIRAAGGGDADFVTVEMSDRDAGYYQSIGRNAWWDATNATLPDFHQAFTWAKAVAEAAGKPLVWWQVPVGNLNQSDTPQHWRDNRVQYFFDHPAELAATHAVGIAFGAGASGQTDPTTDGGYLGSRAAAYAAAGGTPACP